MSAFRQLWTSRAVALRLDQRSEKGGEWTFPQRRFETGVPRGTSRSLLRKEQWRQRLSA